jgi:hypothetical protein
VKKGQPYPNGTNPGGPTKAFTGAWKGLEVFAWYTSWYYNCANIYQDGQILTDTIGQYDAWKPGSDNHRNWPGQQFTVPLLLGEVGWRREGNNEGQQFDKVVNGIVTPLEKYAQSRPTTRPAIASTRSTTRPTSPPTGACSRRRRARPPKCRQASRG